MVKGHNLRIFLQLKDWEIKMLAEKYGNMHSFVKMNKESSVIL